MKQLIVADPLHCALQAEKAALLRLVAELLDTPTDQVNQCKHPASQ